MERRRGRGIGRVAVLCGAMGASLLLGVGVSDRSAAGGGETLVISEAAPPLGGDTAAAFRDLFAFVDRVGAEGLEGANRGDAGLVSRGAASGARPGRVTQPATEGAGAWWSLLLLVGLGLGCLLVTGRRRARDDAPEAGAPEGQRPWLALELGELFRARGAKESARHAAAQARRKFHPRSPAA